jgi:hypothetical protein
MASGELAAKESYSERVQIQLTEIARLAALSNTTNAMLTSNMLRESAEMEVIDRVSAAQKRADDARAKALQDYIKLLNSVGTGITGGTAGSAGSSKVTGSSSTAAKNMIDLTKIDLSNKVARESLNQGLSAGVGLSAALSGARYAAQAAAQYNLTINAGVIAQPDEFSNLIQRTIQNIERDGNPLATAGRLK